MENILETERLQLRKFTKGDADFIVELVNSPTWLKFIGERNVKTTTEAITFLENGILKSYQENGFGLYLVALKNTKIPVGMCGLVKREMLENVDIGFAFLPNYTQKGYAFEIASATIEYAKNSLKIQKIVAITTENNWSSIKLLEKLGLRKEKTIKLSKLDEVLLFSPPSLEG